MMPKPKLFQHVWTGVEQHQNSLIIVSSIIYYTDITISHVVSLGSRLDVSYLQPTVLDSIGTMVPYQTTFWELHGIATLIYLKLHVKYVNLPEHVLIPPLHPVLGFSFFEVVLSTRWQRCCHCHRLGKTRGKGNRLGAFRSLCFTNRVQNSK